MLHYDQIDVFESIDVNKTSASKECNICHYFYFLDKGFKFQRYVSVKLNTGQHPDVFWYCLNSMGA